MKKFTVTLGLVFCLCASAFAQDRPASTNASPSRLEKAIGSGLSGAGGGCILIGILGVTVGAGFVKGCMWGAGIFGTIALGDALAGDANAAVTQNSVKERPSLASSSNRYQAQAANGAVVR